MNLQACWATLAQTYSAAFAGPNDDAWVLLPAVLIFGLMLAVLLAPAVQAAYGRKVKRFMGLREVAVPPSAWWARRQKAMQRPAHAGGAAAALPLAEAMRLRAQRVRRATLAAYAVNTASDFPSLVEVNFPTQFGLDRQPGMDAVMSFRGRPGRRLVNDVGAASVCSPRLRKCSGIRSACSRRR